MDDSVYLYLLNRRLTVDIPKVEVWSRLLVFESASLVEKLLKSRYRKSPRALPAQAFEIAAFMSQGRQFFDSASSASPLVKPLLLYYGVLAFSRATILFTNPGREATLSQAHGITCQSWLNRLSAGVSELPNLGISITKGTFQELSESSQNLETIFVSLNTSEIYKHTRTLSPSLAAISGEISIKDIIARLPDINDLFQETFRSLGSSHLTYVKLYPDQQIDFHVLKTRFGLKSWDDLCEAFDLDQTLSHDETINSHPINGVLQVYFNVSASNFPQDFEKGFLPINNDMRGFAYLVEPFPGGVELSTLSTIYLLSYCLGMIVRYHPSSWAELLGRRSDDSFLPLVTASSSLIENRFPGLILEVLEYGR